MRHSAYMDMTVDKFKAAGEESRLRILAVMGMAGTELCACELMDILGKPQYALSRHLGILVRAGLLAVRREGRNMFYAPRTDGPANQGIFLAVGAYRGRERDLASLRARLAKRQDGCCVVE